MTFPILITSTSKEVAYSTTAVDLAATMGTTGVPGAEVWAFAATTAAWVKQGTCKLVTCPAKASLVDTDFFTVTVDGAAVIYEFDTSGNGATTGRIAVNVSTDTTAAQVAARLRTALLANQATLAVTDNTDGTLTIFLAGALMAITENVANAGFTIASASPTASIGNGSAFIPASTPALFDGTQGPQLGVIRDAADGKASLTKCLMVR